jgi:divalent metal cation (Fe/Co/Zn/Cd) transporter
VPGVLGVHDVRARWVGHKVYTDVAVSVDPQLSVHDADLIASKVEDVLRDHVPLLGHAVVRVSPALTAAQA